MTSTEHGGTSRKWSEDDLDLASSAGTVDPPTPCADPLSVAITNRPLAYPNLLDEIPFSLRQVDQARGDLYAI